ncbi:MAG: hypothetical protein HQK55_05720 [Deltaproteobacteria bacterium]|nr:hypothetical protein [Deltaproteobacteria bacterium]
MPYEIPEVGKPFPLSLPREGLRIVLDRASFEMIGAFSNLTPDEVKA